MHSMHSMHCILAFQSLLKPGKKIFSAWPCHWLEMTIDHFCFDGVASHQLLVLPFIKISKLELNSRSFFLPPGISALASKADDQMRCVGTSCTGAPQPPFEIFSSHFAQELLSATRNKDMTAYQRVLLKLGTIHPASQNSMD